MTAAAARIAVVLPCFNDGPLLLEALASLPQDEPLEVVVVEKVGRLLRADILARVLAKRPSASNPEVDAREDS